MSLRTLIPPELSASARPLGRAGRLFGFALTRRALWLLLAGLVFLAPAFFHPHQVWLMPAWDALVSLLIILDAVRLPAPAHLRVTRRFLDSPTLGTLTRVELEVVHDTSRVLHLLIDDSLDPTLLPTPHPLPVVAFPRDPVRAILPVHPGRRGDLRLGNIFLRYTATLRLVERWAVAPAPQDIRVFPSFSEDAASNSLFLMRARQIELQKRRLRHRGIGREFESLRDYQRGDELRTISWTATARRNRLITRQFTTERSQQVWILLDAGRLSRTAFELRRRVAQDYAASSPEPDPEDPETLQLVVSQLDQAATGAVMLAQAVQTSGDKFGLLTYGRAIQQQLTPGSGPAHLRLLIDQLAQVRSEPAEADHLRAAARLRHIQHSRSLVVWVTEIADAAGTPDVVSAAVNLVRRHLVLLVLLRHPELEALAAAPASSVDRMYRSTGAKEMLDRRRAVIARLRSQGILVVEATPGEIGLRAINSYLEIKAQGLL